MSEEVKVTGGIWRASAEYLERRRRLVGYIKILAGLILLGVGLVFKASPLAADLVKWLALGGTAVWIARLDLGGWFKGLAAREVRLKPAALELKQGNFTRFVMFEEINSLSMVQAKGERVTALKIGNSLGVLNLRGFEDMESLYGELIAKKPEHVIPEIVEIKKDLHDPRLLFWLVAAIVAVLFGLIFLLK